MSDYEEEISRIVEAAWNAYGTSGISPEDVVSWFTDFAAEQGLSAEASNAVWSQVRDRVSQKLREIAVDLSSVADRLQSIDDLETWRWGVGGC